MMKLLLLWWVCSLFLSQTACGAFTSLELNRVIARTTSNTGALQNSDAESAWAPLKLQDRRSAIASTIAAASLLTAPREGSADNAVSASTDTIISISSLSKPSPQYVSSVLLDSKDVRAGLQLYDITLGSARKTYAAVRAIQPDSEAERSGILPGMILLGFPSSAGAVTRIKNGPYPIVLQFYDLAEDVGVSGNMTPQQALENVVAQDKLAATKVGTLSESDGPQLSAKGTGLVAKTIRKGQSCDKKARRGDAVQIRYEARVASPGGPLYDSSNERGAPVSFVLGEGQTINGVEIGMNGMCVGEVRELDIPSLLGYGRFGSEKFDIPGDVRLWWRIELLDLVRSN